MRHEAIIKLAQCADRSINYQATVIVLCNAVVVCLAMYVVIWVCSMQYVLSILTDVCSFTHMLT